MRFVFALTRYLRRLPNEKDSIYITHDIEPSLPILLTSSLRNQLITVRHGIGDYVRKKNDHLYFRHASIIAVYLALERYVLRHASKVIVVSELGLNHYLGKMRDMADKFVLIPTGIDCQKFRPLPDIDDIKRRNAVDPEEPCIFAAARLESEKGLDLLLNAFCRVLRKHPKATAIIAGQGSQERQLKSLAASLGIAQNVRFVGLATGTQLVELYNCADVVALTSYWEGFPVSCLEALACGKPLISTRVGEIPKILRDGETGYFCNSRDPDEYGHLLEMGWDKRRQMAPFCRAIAEEHSSQRMAKNLIDAI
jgi:glycosyltransferase involved in cell wall biosynthesis